MSIWKNVNDKCHFSKEGCCTILKPPSGKLTRECDGFAKKCGFKKTDAEFHDDRDAAIDRCRELGYCVAGSPCKYGNMCLKSDEEGTDGT